MKIMGAQVHKDSRQGESRVGWGSDLHVRNLCLVATENGVRNLCLVATENGWRGEAGGRESHEAVVIALQVRKRVTWIKGAAVGVKRSKQVRRCVGESAARLWQRVGVGNEGEVSGMTAWFLT